MRSIHDPRFSMRASPYAAPGYLLPASTRGLRTRQAARRLGWRLRLPHAGLHTILSRLSPAELRALAGGRLPADPTSAVVGAVGALARRARPAGRLSGGFTVFATPGWRLLIRPIGELEGEIVSLRPAPPEGETGPGKQGLAGPSPRPRTSASGAPTPHSPATVAVAFTWLEGCTLDRACPKSGKGFYVIHNPNGTPVYAGIASNFYTRMLEYSRACRVLERKPADYRVSFARATGLGDALLERYVIRSIIELSGPVQNVDKTKPYVLSKDEVVVTHTGASDHIPAFLKQNKDRRDRFGKTIQHRWNGKTATTTIHAVAEYEALPPSA